MSQMQGEVATTDQPPSTRASSLLVVDDNSMNHIMHSRYIYLQQVGRVTAATTIKHNTVQQEGLDEVANRSDELGQLAQVFQEVAVQVYAREQTLQQQVQQLRIEIDQTRKTREVADLSESEYFQQLLGKAHELRKRARVDQEDGIRESAANKLDNEA